MYIKSPDGKYVDCRIDSIVKLNLTINIRQIPVVRFEPLVKDIYYKSCGFDDAEVIENQQSGDYVFERLGGKDYYIPWLGLYDNNQVPIKIKMSNDNNYNMKFDESLVIYSVGNKVRVNGQSRCEMDMIEPNKRIDISSLEIGVDTLIVEYRTASARCIIGKLVVERGDKRKAGDIVFVITQVSSAKRDDFNAEEMLHEINSIYAQAGIYFDVIQTNSFFYEWNHGDTNRAIMDKYKEYNGVEDNYYYIFIFPELDSSPEIKGNGTMPMCDRKYRIATIYNPRPSVVSHELGHCMGLWHAFEDAKIINKNSDVNKIDKSDRKKYPKKTTTINVMDYNNNPGNDQRKLFYKYQIDHLRKVIK